MSIEFFRPEINRPLDADGFELPPWDNPYFAIPDQGEPSIEDCRWAAEHLELPAPICGGSPAEDDPAGYDEWSRRLDEMHQDSVWQDRLESIYGPHYITDDDVAAGGAAIG